MKQRLAQIKSQEQIKDQEPLTLAFDDNLETGFQLATFQGPLCAEPVEGMAYFVEDLTLDREGIEQEQGVCAQFGTVVRTSWDRCRRRNRSAPACPPLPWLRRVGRYPGSDGQRSNVERRPTRLTDHRGYEAEFFHSISGISDMIWALMTSQYPTGPLT